MRFVGATGTAASVVGALTAVAARRSKRRARKLFAMAPHGGDQGGRSEQSYRKPLFKIEVRMRQDRPSEVITVYEGDTASAITLEFAERHHLSAEGMRLLYDLLVRQMTAQQPSARHQDAPKHGSALPIPLWPSPPALPDILAPVQEAVQESVQGYFDDFVRFCSKVQKDATQRHCPEFDSLYEVRPGEVTLIKTGTSDGADTRAAVDFALAHAVHLGGWHRPAGSEQWRFRLIFDDGQPEARFAYMQHFSSDVAWIFERFSVSVVPLCTPLRECLDCLDQEHKPDTRLGLVIVLRHVDRSSMVDLVQIRRRAREAGAHVWIIDPVEQQIDGVDYLEAACDNLIDVTAIDRDQVRVRVSTGADQWRTDAVQEKVGQPEVVLTLPYTEGGGPAQTSCYL